MNTETQTAGTNDNDTGAATDSLLTGAAEGTTAEGTTAEGIPAEGAPADGTTAPTPADGDEGKSTEYTDFTLPEGLIPGEAIGELKTLAKEFNLKQEDAQKLVDLGAKVVQGIESNYSKQIEEARTQWAADSTADKEFGGDKLQENLALAKRALDTFGSPELSKMLKESGLGNHPEIIRTFFRMGKAVSEDRLIAGTTKPAGAGATAAEVFYDKK